MEEAAPKYDALVDAIHLIQRHLRKEWMVESCQGERVLGCASCTMTRLHEDLAMLMHEVENTLMNDGSRPKPTPTQGED